VIGRLPGEHPCMSLVWAVLDRASAGWRGVAVTPAGTRLLRACAVPCTTHHPNSINNIQHPPPKPGLHQPNPSPSHNITNERNPFQVTFTPLL
jgi:hypothetical protein